MFEELKAKEENSLRNLKVSIEQALKHRGFTVEIISKKKPKMWHKYELIITGQTKDGKKAKTSIIFDSETLVIRFASGNEDIAYWVADIFLKRPSYDMFNFGLSYSRRYY